MGLIYHCSDCNKTLVLGIHTFYNHPLYEKQVLCQDCDLKYGKLRDSMYLEALDKVHTNLTEYFSKFVEEEPEEEEPVEKIPLSEAKSILFKLKELYEEGALSKREYDKEMNRVLRNID